MKAIYLDHNATTPLDPEILTLMQNAARNLHGNPSSLHCYGQKARAALDAAREKVAFYFCCKPSSIIFTSSGTESNNHAILGTARKLKHRGRHIISSTIEHPSVKRCLNYLIDNEGFDVTYVPVNGGGLISTEDVVSAIRSDTILVSIIALNNEIGIKQPVQDIGKQCKERGIIFHTDAVQWFGKESVPSIDFFEADLVSCCGHKFYGPKGCGALFVRPPMQIPSLIMGGEQEFERRAGTENLPAILGFALAIQKFVHSPILHSELICLLSKKLSNLKNEGLGIYLLGDDSKRTPNTLAFKVDDVDSMGIIAALDMEHICVSSGSACSSGAAQPSPILKALGMDSGQKHALVRFSLGRDNTEMEIDHVLTIFPSVIKRIRSF